MTSIDSHQAIEIIVEFVKGQLNFQYIYIYIYEVMITVQIVT